MKIGVFGKSWNNVPDSETLFNRQIQRLLIGIESEIEFLEEMVNSRVGKAEIQDGPGAFVVIAGRWTKYQKDGSRSSNIDTNLKDVIQFGSKKQKDHTWL